MADPLRIGRDDLALQRLGRLQRIFDDRLYMELHTTQVADEPATEKHPARLGQIAVNKALVDLAEAHSIPTVVVCDSHYPCADDYQAHQVWIKAQTGESLLDDSGLFSSGDDYHLFSIEEVKQSISYLGEKVVNEAIVNTQAVADSCTAEIIGRSSTPVFHRKGDDAGPAKDAAVLRQMCLDAWDRRVGKRPNQERYRQQFEQEMDLLVSKGFCGYMLIEADLCRKSKESGILMGPGRGSAAGSLVCYLTGITEIDPIKAKLMFERFLTPGRTSLPDIDSDFPASKRDEVTEYLIERWGRDRVVRVGTTIRLKNKGVFRDVARVLKGTIDEVAWTAIEEVSKIIDAAESGTAGLGLSWEDLWAQHGDELQPYVEAYPVWVSYAEKLVGRLKAFGKHAAGVVIDPEFPIIDRLPLREGEDEDLITEFDMEALEFLGYTKFDVLTLRTLDTIQECIDLIKADPHFTGAAPNLYEWDEEYEDELVWDMLCSGDTVGIFQIETVAGSRLTRRMRPRSIEDLCAILTLVRPGPSRSGLTDSFIKRRNGQEAVDYPHPLLEPVLNETYGAMIYQEDIMAVCRVLAGYTLEEADEVRSVLGKKKVDRVQVEGERFISRCLENGINKDVAVRLWEQMGQFAMYAFNRSHSYSYAVLAYWVAWLKCHYPVHFGVAVMSTVEKDRIPDFVRLATKNGYKVLPPDVNKSGSGFSWTHGEGETLEYGSVIRYGLDSVKGIAGAVVDAIVQGQPYTDFWDFIDRRGSKCNVGHIEVLAKGGALDSLLPPGVNRRALEMVVERLRLGHDGKCRWWDHEHINGFGLPCHYDWANEPIQIGASGKPLKPKPPPKKCTKACRQFEEGGRIPWPDVPGYSDVEISWMEKDTYGIFLSSSPFDIEQRFWWDGITPELRQKRLWTGLQVLDDDLLDPINGVLVTVPALVTKIRKHNDRAQREMAFTEVLAYDVALPVTIFSSVWQSIRLAMKVDSFGLVELKKTERGLHCTKWIPLKERGRPSGSGKA